MRFATRLLVKNNSRKIMRSNSSRGVVRAIKRHCLWKRASVVIGPFLPEGYTSPFSGWMLRMHAASGRGRGGQVSEKSQMELGPIPVSSVRDDKCGAGN